MAEEMLEIVDENDNVIGTASRTEIHAKGLLHREAHVVYVTPAGELIFQRRSKTKDSYPGLLDVTVGGHVEIGDSYEQTAIKEALEETGLNVKASDLVFIHKIRSDRTDVVTGVRNNRFCAVYGYVFKGQLSDLKIEADAADGFEAYSGVNIFNLEKSQKDQFIASLVDPTDFYAPLYPKILALVA